MDKYLSFECRTSTFYSTVYPTFWICCSLAKSHFLLLQTLQNAAANKERTKLRSKGRENKRAAHGFWVIYYHTLYFVYSFKIQRSRIYLLTCKLMREKIGVKTPEFYWTVWRSQSMQMYKNTWHQEDLTSKFGFFCRIGRKLEYLRLLYQVQQNLWR